MADCNELGDEVNNYTYDTKSGNIVSSKDKNNIETSYGYSSDSSTLLQATTNINGLNNTTTYGYTLDFLTKLSHNGFNVSYNYDNQGRTTKISVGGTEYATMEYIDKITKTKFKQDGKDKTIETALDDNGNISSIKYTSLKYSAEEGGETEYEEKVLVTNVYSTHGQLLGSSDGLIGEETDYWYDEKGNLTQIQKDDENFKTCITTTNSEDSSNTHIVIDEYVTEGTSINEYDTERKTSGLSDINYTYTYDTTSVDRNLESIQIKDKDDNVLSYQTIKLDKLGRTKEISTGDFTKQYSYLTKGNHTSNLISSVKYGLNGTTTDNLRYNYDKLGNITEIRENGLLINRYTYDSLSRLIREDNKNLNKTTTYEYDAGGNILHKVEYNYTLVDNLDYEQGNVINYTYPINGWKDKMLSYNGETCEYDELGNPTTYRNHDLTWDYGRRLMSYDTTNYTYDANGIRRSKTVNDVTTHYFTNGSQILGQYDGNLMLFYYGADGVSGFRYSYKDENEVWVNKEYSYKKNILGDIIGIYDSDGNEIVRYMYDGFGRFSCRILTNNVEYIDIDANGDYTKASSDNELIALINPFRYRGYYYDIETKLYYLNSRYYDPETGRFLNADDVSILDTLKDEINGLNLYAYCFNNPINDTDVNGNWSLKKFFKSKVGKIIIGVTIIVAAAALTVATAGGFAAAGTALAGVFTGTASGVAGLFASITVGAAVSSTIGFFAGGFSSLITGGSFWDGAATGFMWGAISGAVSGGLGYLSFGGFGNLKNVYTNEIIGNTVQSFIQGFVSLGAYIGRSFVEGEQITFMGTILSFGSGFVGGLIANVPYQTQVVVSILSELSNVALELFKRVSNIPKNYII